MAEDRIGQALPTVTGIAARLAIAVLKKNNVAIAPLLRAAGLSERDFDSRQNRISAASQGKFLEYAAEAMDDGAFGLHLAEEANPREAGLLFYVTSAANSIGEALTLFARYSRIVNEAARIKLVRSPEGSLPRSPLSERGTGRHAPDTEPARRVPRPGPRAASPTHRRQHPRWEPDALIGPVRFCAGGAQ